MEMEMEMITRIFQMITWRWRWRWAHGDGDEHIEMEMEMSTWRWRWRWAHGDRDGDEHMEMEMEMSTWRWRWRWRWAHGDEDGDEHEAFGSLTWCGVWFLCVALSTNFPGSRSPADDRNEKKQRIPPGHQVGLVECLIFWCDFTNQWRCFPPRFGGTSTRHRWYGITDGGTLTQLANNTRN